MTFYPEQNLDILNTLLHYMYAVALTVNGSDAS